MKKFLAMMSLVATLMAAVNVASAAPYFKIGRITAIDEEDFDLVFVADTTRNLWSFYDPEWKFEEDDVVLITFDDNGTKDRIDDKIVKVNRVFRFWF